MIQGLEELLEYIYFVRDHSTTENYIFGSDSSIDIEGGLFVDRINFNPLPAECPVRVYSTLENAL